MIDLIEIAVCDDEKAIRERIAGLVEKQGGGLPDGTVCHRGRAACGKKAL